MVNRVGWGGGEGGGGKGKWMEMGAGGDQRYLLSGTVQLKLQLDPFLGSPTPSVGPIHPQEGIFSPIQSQTQLVTSQCNARWNSSHMA